MCSGITKKDRKYLRTLFTLACSVEPIRSSRVAAFVTLKNKVIAFGHNQRKTSPFQAKFSSNSRAIYLHAETHAIKNALRLTGEKTLEKYTLYVVRAKYSRGRFVKGISKPCEGCQSCIEHFRVGRVVHVSHDGPRLL